MGLPDLFNAASDAGRQAGHEKVVPLACRSHAAGCVLLLAAQANPSYASDMDKLNVAPGSKVCMCMGSWHHHPCLSLMIRPDARTHAMHLRVFSASVLLSLLLTPRWHVSALHVCMATSTSSGRTAAWVHRSMDSSLCTCLYVQVCAVVAPHNELLSEDAAQGKTAAEADGEVRLANLAKRPVEPMAMAQGTCRRAGGAGISAWKQSLEAEPGTRACRAAGRQTVPHACSTRRRRWRS